MADYPTKIIPHAEMVEMFQSAEVQEFLHKDCEMVRVKLPYRLRHEKLHNFVLKDNPTETVVVVWTRVPRSKEDEKPWYELIVFNSIQHIPGPQSS